MKWKQHSAILLNGFVILTPILVTAFVVVNAVVWVDDLILRDLLKVPEDTRWAFPLLGVLIALAGVYTVGLMARNWLFRKALGLGERVVEQIPLVKSIYSALRDMLQLFSRAGGGTGQAVELRSDDGRYKALGMVMREHCDQILQDGEDRVAVYLPMSYQIGGYTLFVPRAALRPLEHMSVEDLIKITLTGGAGAGAQAGPSPAPGERGEENKIQGECGRPNGGDVGPADRPE